MFLHPLRRLADLDILQYAYSKTTAQVSCLYIYFRHFSSAATGGFLYAHIRQAQFRTQNSGSLAGQAKDIGTVAAVSRQIDIQNHVIQA